jgi:hypothetical protein
MAPPRARTVKNRDLPVSSPETGVNPIQDGTQNRVGGGFTSAVLSHHRTYGSVYGGSGYAVKPFYRIQY